MNAVRGLFKPENAREFIRRFYRFPVVGGIDTDATGARVRRPPARADF